MSNEKIAFGPLLLFGAQRGPCVEVSVRSLRDYYIGTLTATVDEWQSLRALADSLGAGDQRHAEDAKLLAHLRQTIADARRVLVAAPHETLLDAAVRCMRQRDAARRDAEELRAERDVLKQEVRELEQQRDALHPHQSYDGHPPASKVRSE